MNVKFILFLGLATAAGTLPAQKLLYSPEKQIRLLEFEKISSHDANRQNPQGTGSII